MHSALLVVEMPHVESKQWNGLWLPYIDIVSRIKENSEHITLCGENCLLFPLQSELQAFVRLAYEAQRIGLSYKVTFFKEAPEWFSVNP